MRKITKGPEDLPKRLFDCLDFRIKHFPDTEMLAAKEEGKWRTYSNEEVKDKVDRLSAALLSMGISSGDGTTEGRDKVAILSPNCPEWILVDLAVQQIGAVSVPIYPNINENELQFILEDSKVKIAFVKDETLRQQVASLQDTLPDLENIYTFEAVPGKAQWSDLLTEISPELLIQVQQKKEEVQENDLVSILYTSGTTGRPKGVMLSHRNITSDAIGSIDVIREVGIVRKRVLSFLPLNHAFERTATYCYFYSGASVYYAEGLDKIAENLKEVKPVLFTTVPRLLEKVYEGILAKGEELTGAKKRLFFWALDLAANFEINTPRSLGYRIQLALADKLIFSKWREALGGQVKAVITGAAACQVRLLRIFTAAGIVIQEGYGLTEAAPIISGNRYHEKGRMFGTVGPPINNVEVRIAPDGEILCKGPNVMLGYYKQPKLTSEVMDGEWLRTGDIGAIVEGKFLKITDRKKELFKTSGGKYVAPQPIENKMVESQWIEQIMLVGEGQKFVGALIVPAFHSFRKWYTEQDQPYPGNEALSNDQKVEAMIKKDIKEFNKLFNHIEQVKKFQLLPAEWSIEAGELTPTLKVKRKVILEKYKAVIDSMY